MGIFGSEMLLQDMNGAPNLQITESSQWKFPDIILIMIAEWLLQSPGLLIRYSDES